MLFFWERGWGLPFACFSLAQSVFPRGIGPGFGSVAALGWSHTAQIEGRRGEAIPSAG